MWESVHRDWSKHLVELGLDPELFRYQRAMNAGEGEAAEAFSFTTDEQFVDFLLRAVVDQEEPKGLAEVVAGYAAKIAQWAELELEREFVDGTLDRLDPLAEAEQAAVTARSVGQAATDRARDLAVAIAARHQVEIQRLGAGRRVAGAGRRGRTGRRRRGAAGCTRRRHVVEPACRRGCRAAVRGRRDRTRRAGRAQGVRRRDDGRMACRGAGAAGPARHRRDGPIAPDVRGRKGPRAPGTAGQTGSGCCAGRRAALRDRHCGPGRRGSGEQVTEAAGRAETGTRTEELGWAGRLAAEHRASADQAHVVLSRIRDQVAEATRAGLLAPDEDPAAAQPSSRERAEVSAADAVERSITEHAALRGRPKDRRRTGHRRPRRGVRIGQRHLGRLGDRPARAARAKLAELAEAPRLAELLGVQTVQPDRDDTALLERLAAAVESAEEERAELRAAQQRDSRAIRALGEGGLLPVPAEIEQALAVLEAAGIVAHAGWRYLARLPQDRRAATIERVPHLVSGVLLDDSADAPRAREELTRAQLLPCAVVAVGSTGSMHTGTMHTDGPGIDFVVPPNPAMFDERTADQVRVELTEASTARRARTAELETRLETDRALGNRLRSWRCAYPQGCVEQLAEAADRAQAVAGRARAASERAVAEVAQLDARSEALDAELPALRAAEQDATATARRLAALRDEAERRPELLELIRQETVAAQAADAHAARAREAGVAARRDEQEMLRAGPQRLGGGHRRATSSPSCPLMTVTAKATGPISWRVRSRPRR